jgi:hypothetical protein
LKVKIKNHKNFDKRKNETNKKSKEKGSNWNKYYNIIKKNHKFDLKGKIKNYKTFDKKIKWKNKKSKVEWLNWKTSYKSKLKD